MQFLEPDWTFSLGQEQLNISHHFSVMEVFVLLHRAALLVDFFSAFFIETIVL